MLCKNNGHNRCYKRTENDDGSNSQSKTENKDRARGEKDLFNVCTTVRFAQTSARSFLLTTPSSIKQASQVASGSLYLLSTGPSLDTQPPEDPTLLLLNHEKHSFVRLGERRGGTHCTHTTNCNQDISSHDTS